MHRHSWIALSWCFVIALALVILMEVHRDHAAPAAAPPVAAPTPVPATRGAAVPLPVQLQDPEPEPPPVVEAALVYSGNTKSDIFHRPSCRHFTCKNCRAKFATRDEALAAGFDPCGTCNP